MKAIIAGGRDYSFTNDDYYWLDELLEEFSITEIVHGGARGADACADRWAKDRGVKVKPFPVSKKDWDTIGKRAGPLRNRKMARYVGEYGLCILFPGGDGTASMREEADIVGVRVIEKKE